MSDLKRLLELAGVKWPTIMSSTKSNGEIDRKKANKMVDPKGWFPATKRAVHEDDRYENFADGAEAYAAENFSPQEFLDSEAFQQISHPGITQDDVMSALEFYLGKFINRHYVEQGDPYYSADTSNLAKHLYPQVHQALEHLGLTSGLHNDE